MNRAQLLTSAAQGIHQRFTARTIRLTGARDRNIVASYPHLHQNHRRHAHRTDDYSCNTPQTDPAQNTPNAHHHQDVAQGVVCFLTTHQPHRKPSIDSIGHSIAAVVTDRMPLVQLGHCTPPSHTHRSTRTGTHIHTAPCLALPSFSAQFPSFHWLVQWLKKSSRAPLGSSCHRLSHAHDLCDCAVTGRPGLASRFLCLTMTLLALSASCGPLPQAQWAIKNRSLREKILEKSCTVAHQLNTAHRNRRPEAFSRPNMHFIPCIYQVGLLVQQQELSTLMQAHIA